MPQSYKCDMSSKNWSYKSDFLIAMVNKIAWHIAIRFLLTLVIDISQKKKDFRQIK